jgi:hypothetical protein
MLAMIMFLNQITTRTKKSWLLLLFLVLLVSCTHESRQHAPIKSTHLKGVEVQIEEGLVIDAHVIDSFLVLKHQKGAYHFSIYKIGEWTKSYEFGKRGNGPEEFSSLNLTNQFVKYSNSLNVYLIDPFAKKIYKAGWLASYPEVSINLVEEYSGMEGFAQDVFRHHEEKGLFGVLEGGTNRFFKKLNTDEIIQYIAFESAFDHLPIQVKTYIEKEIVRINPDTLLLASVFKYQNRLEVINLSGKIIREYQGVNENKFENPKEGGDDLICYYEDLFVTTRFIYGLFIQQRDDDVADREKTVQVHVFDWDLQLVHILQMDEYLLQIAIDEMDSLLIGIDYLNERLLYYHLPEIDKTL